MKQGITPAEHCQIDVMSLPRCTSYRYLLVIVDTFFGSPEAFPCHTKKAREIIKALSKEILPRFDIPEGLSSDIGPHFIVEIVEGISRFWANKGNLQAPWNPQSTGKVIL